MICPVGRGANVTEENVTGRTPPQDQIRESVAQSGPFTEVGQSAFAELLRDLAAHDLLVQMHDGTVVLGLEGERLVNRVDFYSAFVTSDEYRLVFGAQTLGTIPVTRPLAVGDLLLFAGRRWRVLEVRDTERLIQLEPAPGGRAPRFSGGAALVDDAVRRTTRELYEGVDDRPYLDTGARRLLAEGREAFRRLGLTSDRVLEWCSDVVLFPWVGVRALDTLALMLAHAGLDAARDGAALLISGAGREDVRSALTRVAASPPSATELAQHVRNKRVEKHHDFLGDALLDADYASSRVDVDRACEAVRSTL